MTVLPGRSTGPGRGHPLEEPGVGAPRSPSLRLRVEEAPHGSTPCDPHLGARPKTSWVANRMRGCSVAITPDFPAAAGEASAADGHARFHSRPGPAQSPRIPLRAPRPPEPAVSPLPPWVAPP